jgi:hypothetical protein
MEYLSLQDIPHRQYDSMHSHRMTSISSERPLGSMAAAVSPHSYLPPPLSPLLPFRSLLLPPMEPRSAKRKAMSLPSIPLELQEHRRQKRRCTGLEDDIRDKWLSGTQNAQMRSSPPIQPNERVMADKLPSFSEVCCCRSHGTPSILIGKVHPNNTRAYPASNSVTQAGLQ